MKTVLLLSFISLFLCTDAISKNDTTSNYTFDDSRENELNINLSFFIKQFLSFNNSDLLEQSPYLINYKHYFGCVGLRTGTGFNFENSVTKDINDLELKNKFHSFDIRVGAEMKKRLANRWLINYGVDLIYNRTKSTVITDNGFDVTTDLERTNGIGGGPVLGISFMISERIRLYTESTVYFLHANELDETKFQNFPEFNLKETGTRDELQFNLPTTLFFTITL